MRVLIRWLHACQYRVAAMAQEVEKRMGARREDLMVAKLDRLREQASMGFATITGHQKEKTNLRWWPVGFYKEIIR